MEEVKENVVDNKKEKEIDVELYPDGGPYLHLVVSTSNRWILKNIWLIPLARREQCDISVIAKNNNNNNRLYNLMSFIKCIIHVNPSKKSACMNRTNYI